MLFSTVFLLSAWFRVPAAQAAEQPEKTLLLRSERPEQAQLRSERPEQDHQKSRFLPWISSLFSLTTKDDSESFFVNEKNTAPTPTLVRDKSTTSARPPPAASTSSSLVQLQELLAGATTTTGDPTGPRREAVEKGRLATRWKETEEQSNASQTSEAEMKSTAAAQNKTEDQVRDELSAEEDRRGGKVGKGAIQDATVTKSDRNQGEDAQVDERTLLLFENVTTELQEKYEKLLFEKIPPWARSHAGRDAERNAKSFDASTQKLEKWRNSLAYRELWLKANADPERPGHVKSRAKYLRDQLGVADGQQLSARATSQLP